MTHDGKRDGWDMLLAGSDAVLETRAPAFFPPWIQDESEKNAVAEAKLTASQRPN